MIARVRPLPAPHTKAGKLQRACLDLLREHEHDDAGARREPRRRQAGGGDAS
jgi:hypothetical protein